MAKIEHFYQKIHGWFTFKDLYTEMVKNYDDAVFVEVGTWKGKSASYMATEIANSNKNIKFYCIDPWTGETLDSDPKGYDCIEKMEGTLFEHFLQNVHLVRNYLTPIRGLSNECVKHFDDSSLSFVYIDASHDYKSVLNDLEIWYPKIKKGGVLAGHDYPKPGVLKAVNCFASINKLVVNKHPQDDNTYIFNL